MIVVLGVMDDIMALNALPKLIVQILSAVLTALYLMQIVLLAFFPRQNRQLSVRVPKRARRDPGLRMTVPITALAAGSVALGLGAGRLAGTVVALLG